MVPGQIDVLFPTIDVLFPTIDVLECLITVPQVMHTLVTLRLISLEASYSNFDKCSTNF